MARGKGGWEIGRDHLYNFVWHIFLPVMAEDSSILIFYMELDFAGIGYLDCYLIYTSRGDVNFYINGIRINSILIYSIYFVYRYVYHNSDCELAS